MTVARLRERGGAGADSVDVMFLESARIYKLAKAHPAFQQMHELLREAMAERRPMTVRVASEDSDVIEHVAPRA